MIKGLEHLIKEGKGADNVHPGEEKDLSVVSKYPKRGKQ